MQNSMKFSSDIFHCIHISLNPFEICVHPACSQVQLGSVLKMQLVAFLSFYEIASSTAVSKLS